MNYRYVGSIKADGWTAIDYAAVHGGNVRNRNTGKMFSPREVHEFVDALNRRTRGDFKFNASDYEYVAPAVRF